MPEQLVKYTRHATQKRLAGTIAPRIGPSYYLTVSDTGEIIASDPPLAKLCPSA